MFAKTLFLAATCGLIAGAANAQQVYPPHVDMPVAAQTGVVPSATNLDAPKPVDPLAPVAVDASTTAPGGELRQTAPALSGVTTVELVASAPVPDSPESRKLYPPLSRGGQMTAPRGN